MRRLRSPIAATSARPPGVLSSLDIPNYCTCAIQATSSATCAVACTKRPATASGLRPKRPKSQREGPNARTGIQARLCISVLQASADSNLRACNIHTLLPLLLHGQSTRRDSSASNGSTDHEPPPRRAGPRLLLLLLLVNLVHPRW